MPKLRILLLAVAIVGFSAWLFAPQPSQPPEVFTVPDSITHTHIGPNGSQVVHEPHVVNESNWSSHHHNRNVSQFHNETIGEVTPDG